MRKVLVIESETKNIEKLRFFLKSIFVECGLCSGHFNRVFLGVSEAVCNSIIHGNNLELSKHVFVEAEWDNGKLVFTVKDEGVGFDHRFLDDPTISKNRKKESGRGIFLLRSVADSVVFSNGGTQVCIKFNLSK